MVQLVKLRRSESKAPSASFSSSSTCQLPQGVGGKGLR